MNDKDTIANAAQQLPSDRSYLTAPRPLLCVCVPVRYLLYVCVPAHVHAKDAFKAIVRTPEKHKTVACAVISCRLLLEREDDPTTENAPSDDDGSYFEPEYGRSTLHYDRACTAAGLRRELFLYYYYVCTMIFE